MLVFKEEYEIDVNEGENEKSQGEAELFNKVHFHKQWEIKCSD